MIGADMKSASAVWGSLLFTVVVPGTVAGLVPLFISGWRFEDDFPPVAPTCSGTRC